MVNTELIVKEYLEELSLETIAKRHGCSRFLIKKVLAEQNIPLRTKRIRNGNMTYKQQLEIVDLYNNGLSAREIATQFKVDVNTIGIYLKRRGVERNYNQIRVVNHNPFMNIGDNYSTDYWLGYFIADGHLELPNRISIYSKDLCILDQFKSFLNSDVSILKMSDKTNVHYIRFSNANASKCLQLLGVTPNKSLTLDLNFDLNWSFIHGLFDGDGHFYFNNSGHRLLSICTGSELFAVKIRDFYTSHNIVSKIQLDENTFKVNIYNKQGVEIFYEEIYKKINNKYFLNRKKEHFDKYFNGI